MTEFDPELLKNLQEDLHKFGFNPESGLGKEVDGEHLQQTALLQDYVPYNESIFWTYSTDYYEKKGIKAWSNKAPKIIPHKSGSNYQNALAFAKLIKKQLEFYPNDKVIKVLECGSGSGRFARHFLLAAQELEILDRVKFLISDYSVNTLSEVKNKGILSHTTCGSKAETLFEEGKHYDYVHLDVMDLKSAKDLNGSSVKLENISAIFMHYLFDALPLTIVTRNKDDQIEELNISISLRLDQGLNIMENDFLQSRLEREYKWVEYDWAKQSELEEKYKDHLIEYAKQKNPEDDVFYNYGDLKACEELLGVLDDKGFLFSSDITPGQKERYVVVGNSIAHEVDNNFLASYFPKFHSYISFDKAISRWLSCKNAEVFTAIKDVFVEVYETNNMLHRYIELEKNAEEFKEKETADILKVMLGELSHLAPHYAFTYELWSRYYEMIGDSEKQKMAINKAKSIDFWGDVSSQ